MTAAMVQSNDLSVIVESPGGEVELAGESEGAARANSSASATKPSNGSAPEVSTRHVHMATCGCIVAQGSPRRVRVVEGAEGRYALAGVPPR